MGLESWPWLSGALEVLLPRECLVCTRPVRGASLCFRCTPLVPKGAGAGDGRCPRCFGPMIGSGSECGTCLLFPPAFDRSRHVWEYGGLARDLIRAMKFRPSVILARMGGDILADSLSLLFGNISTSWDVVVPVPASRANFRRRLFHPCVEIAQRIVIQGHAPRVLNALRHSKHRAPQASLSHDERLRGIRRMFEARNESLLQGRRILLVEDVITTGATTAAAVLALRRAGAASVDIAALAQTSVWQRFRRRIWEGARKELEFGSPCAGNQASILACPTQHTNVRPRL